MNSLKFFIVLSALAAVGWAKVVNVRNTHSTPLLVNAGGTEYTVAAKGVVILNLEDGWSGSISAVPAGAEVTDGPRTEAQLSISASGDSYSVSLENGFNLGVKVIPTGSSSCEAVVCSTRILNVCPVANQVTNSLLEVVACQNSPLIMSALCPLAVVDAATSVNVQTCLDATAFMVLFT